MINLGRQKFRPWHGLLFICVFISFFSLLPVKTLADGTIRNFKAKGTLQPGMVVSLVKGSKDTLQALPANSTQLAYGVVVDPSNVPLTVGKSPGQVYAASSGTFLVLVSTQNGAVKSGDYLSASSIGGVAAAATVEQPVVLGRALQDFKGGSAAIFSVNGSAVGEVLASISPGNNPKAITLANVPSSLKKVSNTIAGKNVSALRIYGAVLILMIGLAIAGILLLGGIRHGMSAIGRNPLSRKSIYKSLIQVMIVVVLVFIASLMGIYILLKL